MTRWQKLKHAFAVDPPGPVEPTEVQQVGVDWVCRQVAKRHLTTPGIFALEMSRPLNWVTAQAMHVMSPIVWALARQLTHEHYKEFAAFLEQRGAFDYLVERIQHFENEYERQARGDADTAESVENQASSENLTGDHEEHRS
jgi:hypothetical protein